MNVKEILKSKRVRKRVQLGVIPMVVGAIHAKGADGLITTFGFVESLVLLGTLIVAQMSLIVARVQFDFTMD